MDIYERTRFYMRQGYSLDEAIVEVEKELHGQLSEYIKALIRTEINFTRDLEVEQEDKLAMEEAHR